MAAFANGAAAHAFELDDVHEEAISHPGAVVVPAAMAVAETIGKPLINSSNSRRAVGCYLFAQAEVEAHVQERIGPPALRREFLIEVLGRNRVVVLGVRIDDIGDLRLQRRQRAAVHALTPRVRVHPAQIGAILGEDHSNSFLRYSHHSTIGHSPHIGLRALQT